MKIERRSIEFVPEDERYGSAKSLFTIWFSSNMQITTAINGALGIALGLNLYWTFVALIIGNLIGGIFMASHSAQGPHIGIPQMISSRAQFGVKGAVFPIFIVFCSYILFTAANALIVKDSIQAAVPLSDNSTFILFGVITLIVSFLGYNFIHKMGKFLTVLSSIIFLIATVLVFQLDFPKGSWSPNEGFHFATFMLVISFAASWELGFGPYVADYSRYLPSNTPTRSTFWYSYAGNVIGATWMMLLGALLAAGIPNFMNVVSSSIAKMFGPFSGLAFLSIFLGILLLNALNLYSAFMSWTTMVAYKSTGISTKVKFSILFGCIVIATSIAIGTQHNFNAYFADIMVGQMYVLLPWTSINLIDFYLVRKGNYSIPDIYNENGIYKKYNWGSLLCYLISVIIEIPFMGFSFYQGFVLKSLGGADITWAVGLVVPALLYYLLMRNRVSVTTIKPAEEEIATAIANK
ncbi:purine-cytosine permease family protein [Peribacillus simplex]|uniref:purine-cytosine permease family protein n=1 Tax=Peribacillus simplex TaxID=1478 RepID=UPI00366BA8F5